MLWNLDQCEALIPKRCPARDFPDQGVACSILHALSNGENVAFESWSPSTPSGLSEHEFAIMPCSVAGQPDPLDGRHPVPGSDSNQYRGPEGGFGLAAERASWMKA
jgi:hypothetical protein